MTEKKPISGEVIQPDQYSDDGTKPGDRSQEIKDHKSYTQGRRGKKPERSDAEADQEERNRQAFAVTIFHGGFEWGHEEDETRVPTEDEKRLVRTMSYAGFTQDQIASAIKMSKHRLFKIFKYELENARVILTSEILGSLAYRARMGSDSAAIFLLKTRGGDAFKQVQYIKDESDPALEPTKAERQQFIDKIVAMVQNSVKSAEAKEKLEEEPKSDDNPKKT